MGLAKPIHPLILSRNSTGMLLGCGVKELFLFSFFFFSSVEDTIRVWSFLLTGARRQPSPSPECQRFLVFAWEVFSGALVQNGINSMTSVT